MVVGIREALWCNGDDRGGQCCGERRRQLATVGTGYVWWWNGRKEEAAIEWEKGKKRLER